MKREKKWRPARFSLLFLAGMLLATAFVVTVSFILFFRFADIDIPRSKLWAAALVNFGNTVFITLIFWLADALRRKLTVEEPVNRIVYGLEQLSNGDFSARIERVKMLAPENQYNVIIEYINQLAAELDGVETLRTDFVSNVSHEMKTPLAVIQNYTELLRPEGLPEEERAEYLDAISASADGLAETVSNILKLNKLENQQIFPENKPYDLSVQVGECLLGYEMRFEEKSLRIEAELDEDAVIQADEQLMSLVWNNLFSNAAKFTDVGGKITVRLKKASGAAIVTVADTGCGMDEATMQHIFDKFYQGDTSHAVRGNGLGLALVKRIVDISGGEVTVRSSPGVGSEFTVILETIENQGGSSKRHN